MDKCILKLFRKIEDSARGMIYLEAHTETALPMHADRTQTYTLSSIRVIRVIRVVV